MYVDKSRTEAEEAETDNTYADRAWPAAPEAVQYGQATIVGVLEKCVKLIETVLEPLMLDALTLPQQIAIDPSLIYPLATLTSVMSLTE